MHPRAPLTAALAAALLAAVPASALADVPVRVPRAFLGGPIGTPVPVPVVAAPVTDPARASLPAVPEGSALVDQPDGLPSRPPRDDLDGCADAAAGGCVRSGDDADIDIGRLLPGLATLPVDPDAGETRPDFTTPGPGAMLPDDGGDDAGAPSATLRPMPARPALPPSPAQIAVAAGGLITPPAADWLPWQTPVLRWRAAPGAAFYNVQVFRGPRRVLNAWSRSTRLRVPPGVLDQGRPYVWVVWPGAGTKARPRFGAPVGRSTFQVTLRPRLVIRRPGGARGRVVAETRPHLPGAVLRLTAPPALRGRVPHLVRVDARGLIALPVSARAAERLHATLVDPGPTPPLGLRGRA